MDSLLPKVCVSNLPPTGPDSCHPRSSKVEGSSQLSGSLCCTPGRTGSQAVASHQWPIAYPHLIAHWFSTYNASQGPKYVDNILIGQTESLPKLQSQDLMTSSLEASLERIDHRAVRWFQKTYSRSRHPLLDLRPIPPRHGEARQLCAQRPAGTMLWKPGPYHPTTRPERQLGHRFVFLFNGTLGPGMSIMVHPLTSDISMWAEQGKYGVKDMLPSQSGSVDFLGLLGNTSTNLAITSPIFICCLILYCIK